MIPEINILTPPKWKDGSSALLSEMLHKKGIKASLPPAGSLPAKTSNFNLFIHLGDKKSFVHREDKYNRFNIHIGFDQTNAWIYIGGTVITNEDPNETTQSFITAYNELVSCDSLKGVLKQIDQSDLAFYWKNIAYKITWINPYNVFIPLLSVFKFDEDDKHKTYRQRLRKLIRLVYSDSHVPSELLYNYAVLLFIRDYLDPYLNSLGIKVEKKGSENQDVVMDTKVISEGDSAEEK